MAERDQSRIGLEGKALDRSLQKMATMGFARTSLCPGAESCWQQSCSFAFSPHHALGQ